MRHLSLFFDGSITENPGGTAAYGFALHENATLLDSGSGIIGTGPWTSNNLAEFYSLYHGLRCVSTALGDTRGGLVTVKGDSDLVIKIMNKRWRAKKHKLYYSAYKLADMEVRKIRKQGVSVTFDWIPRELNREADSLSKINRKKD